MMNITRYQVSVVNWNYGLKDLFESVMKYNNPRNNYSGLARIFSDIICTTIVPRNSLAMLLVMVVLVLVHYSKSY